MSARTADSAQPPLIVEGLFSYQIGGSERVGVDLALGFRRRGYRVACFAMYDSHGPFRDELEANGLECVDLDYTSRPSVIRRFTYQAEMYAFLKRRNAQALHVHHATALVLCGRAARLARTPHVVMTEHAIHQLVDRPDYRRQATRYCGYATAITAVHQGIADYFHEHMAVPRQRLHVISNGARIAERDPAQSRQLRTALGLALDALVVMYVGRLDQVKDLATLMRGFASAAASNLSLRLILVGDGPERQGLESLARELGIGTNVLFLGFRQDIPALLQVADIFAMSSRTEGLPMAMIEAMGAGIPCISTAVGGIPELLADEHGVCVPPGKPEALAEGLRALAADPALRAHLGARCRRKVEKLYGLESVVTHYLELMDLHPFWTGG